VEGSDRFWGPYGGSHQVWEARIPPGEKRTVRLEMRPVTKEEQAALNKLLDPQSESARPQHFDCVFDAVGGAVTREQAVRACRSGGVIVHIGLMDNKGSMDVRAMTLREITFIGTYTYTPVDLRATLHKLHGGALGDLGWIEQRPLAAGATAFSELLRGQCAAPKIVLQTG